MPAYRLRDVAVLIGAVVVGAAAGFNGGWFAAVPPKVVTVETPNKLATGNADVRTPPTAPAPEAQVTPAIQPTAAPAAPATTAATAESTPQSDPRNIRVIRPVEQANEISATARQAVAPSPAQAEPAPVPAENKAVRVVPTSPQSTPTPARQTPAVKQEAPAQAAITEPDVPRTTGQGEGRKSDAKNKSDVKSKSDSKNKSDVDKPDVKNKSQTASDQKVKRKDIKRQDSDSIDAATAETDSREVRSDAKKNKKTVVQKAKRKDLRREEVDSDDESEVAEPERRPVTTGRSFRREEREEVERVPAGDRARGRAVIERERERSPREVVVEEPRQSSGPFDFFFGR
jgi:hypothetical protein